MSMVYEWIVTPEMIQALSILLAEKRKARY